MKKFLGILAIAGVLVACNNSGSSSTATDSTTKTADSINASTIPPADTTSKMSDTTSVKTDTATKKVDAVKTKK